jgi:hypothetical protein
MHAKRAALKPTETVRPPVTQQQPRSLGSRRYGLPDMVPLTSVRKGAQTVDQEFRAYSMATLSSKGTNILGFWQVRAVSP